MIGKSRDGQSVEGFNPTPMQEKRCPPNGSRAASTPSKVPNQIYASILLARL